MLAVRYGLGVEPGLVTLAAVARAGRHDDPDRVWDHAQELPGGLGVVVCPEGAEQVHSALRAAGPAVARWLAGLAGVDVIVDAGRLDLGSVASPFVSEANVVLMVARPVAEQLNPAARHLEALATDARPVAWLLVGDEPHGPTEVEDVYGFEVAGVVAHDARGAAAVEGSGTRRRIERSTLMRSAATVAAVLAARLHSEPGIGSAGEPRLGVESSKSQRPAGDLTGNGSASDARRNGSALGQPTALGDQVHRDHRRDVDAGWGGEGGGFG